MVSAPDRMAEARGLLGTRPDGVNVATYDMMVGMLGGVLGLDATRKAATTPEALGDLIGELVGDHVDRVVGSLAARVDGLERAAALKTALPSKPRVRVPAVRG